MHEIGLALSPDGPLMFKWLPADHQITDGRLQVLRANDQTVYEAAIPWTHIGSYSPAVGRPMTFSLTLNDADGRGFRGWLAWASGICGGKDASSFGWLDFVDAEP